MGKLRSMICLIALLIAPISCDRSKELAAAAGQPVELTWMLSVGPDRPMFEQLLRRFHELHPDIRVRPMWVPSSQYQLKLKTLIAAGQAPDIFWSGDVWVGYELPFLADLNDLVQRDARELD